MWRFRRFRELEAGIRRCRVSPFPYSILYHDEVPKAMDHHSSGCLPGAKFPRFASGRQDRGQVNPSGFRPQFRLTRLRDVPREESPAYGDGFA